MEKELWVNFHHPDGRCLLSYTVRGTFPGEMEDTKQLLAADYNILPQDITITITLE